MTEEVSMNSAAKHYYANKDAILQYKKQYYQEKNKMYIFLKQFQIIGISRRNSNKLLKKAYNSQNFYVNVTDQYGNNETKEFGSIKCSHMINGIIQVEACFKNIVGDIIIEDINTISSDDYDDIFNNGNHILYLTIKYPIIRKE
jgi:uncharacterized membrane protein